MRSTCLKTAALPADDNNVTSLSDAQAAPFPARAADHLAPYHRRIRERGVSLFWYRLVQLTVFRVVRRFFRVEVLGSEHIPEEGPVILVANHRSFLDSSVLPLCTWRPIYSVAKQEIFHKRWQGRLLNAFGAFPIRARESDPEALETAKLVLERGDVFCIFPEGIRMRSGLGNPKRGAARMALETGAMVVPIAISGTERARRRWLIRPVKVRVLCGPPLQYVGEASSPQRAADVLEDIWAQIETQWEQLERRAGRKPSRPARESPAYPSAGDHPTCSGGSASLLPRARLEWHGQRFLAGMVPGEDIASMTGGGEDPIRVYVGLAHASSIKRRVDLAIAELERLEAFSRRQILVFAPTGMGCVNPIPVEAAEYMSHGGIATVVLQYASRRSWRATRQVPFARDAYRLLLQRIAERANATEEPPELLLYGESLGAWAALAAVADRGPAELGLDRGLWAGVPSGARHLQEKLERAVAVSRFTQAADFPAQPADGPARPAAVTRAAERWVVLTHRNDPVATFTKELIWHKPASAERGWVPLLSFLHNARVLMRATDIEPGRPNPHGHDYRGELPAAVRFAYGYATPDDLLARIQRRAWARDVARAEVEAKAAAVRPLRRR